MMAAEEAKPTGIVRFGIVFGAVLAVMVQAIDSTIASVALPHMQGSLSASQDEIAWVITSYIVAVAIMTAPSGWLANQFGRKRTLLVAVVGFTAASVLTGFAQTLDQVVLCRFLQGAFGAPLVPLSQSLLLDTYESKDSMRALAWYSVGVTVGPVMGPNLGGWITEHWDWRWVFFINVPIGIACFASLMAFVPETKKQRTDFDWFGFAMLSLFIGAFQLVMDRGSEKDWFGSTEILVEACLAGLGFYIFAVHTLTTNKPFIDFGTLRDRNFAFGTLYTLLNSVLIIVAMVLIPSFLQNVVGDPVGWSGVVTAPRAMGGAFVLLFVGQIQRRMDPRLMALCGLGMLAYGLLRMAQWTENVSSVEVMTNGFLSGAGATIAYVPMQTMMFSGITPARRNGAATVFGLTRNLGQSIGVSAATALLVRNIQINHAGLAVHATPFNRGLQSGAAHHFWNLGRMAGVAALDNEIGRQAALIAYLDVFRLLTYVTLAIIPLVFLLRLPGYLDGSRLKSGAAG